MQGAAYMSGPATMASVFGGGGGRDHGQAMPGLHAQGQAAPEPPQQPQAQDRTGQQQQQQPQAAAAVRMPPPGPSAPYANGGGMQSTPAGGAQKVHPRSAGVGDSPGLDRDFPHLALINDLLE